MISAAFINYNYHDNSSARNSLTNNINFKRTNSKESQESSQVSQFLLLFIVIDKH